MLGSDVFYKKIKPITYSFIIIFTDDLKAEIQLTQLAWIEQFYKRDLLSKLKLLTTRITFLHICKCVIIVQLELDLSGNGSENICVDTKTIVALTLTPVSGDKPIKAKGITTDNKIDLLDT